MLALDLDFILASPYHGQVLLALMQQVSSALLHFLQVLLGYGDLALSFALLENYVT